MGERPHKNASAEGPEGYIHVPGGKTGAVRRNIPLTPRGKAILEAPRTRNVLSFYVFPGRGKSGHLVTIQHSHERAVKTSGVDAFEFYCWRHTCGTRWAESGMDKYTV